MLATSCRHAITSRNLSIKMIKFYWHRVRAFHSIAESFATALKILRNFLEAWLLRQSAERSRSTSTSIKSPINHIETRSRNSNAEVYHHLWCSNGRICMLRKCSGFDWCLRLALRGFSCPTEPATPLVITSICDPIAVADWFLIDIKN